MKSSIASFVSVFALTFVGIFPTQPANSVEPTPTPDLNDIYYPILKGLKVEVDVAAKADENKKITFPTVAKVELKVKYHRNSTYALEIEFVKFQGETNRTCSNKFYLRAPASSFEIPKADSTYPTNEVVVRDKIGNRKILEKLVKREKVGDWFEESFEFTTPIFDNEFLEPCMAEYRARTIRIYDVAGKRKTINNWEAGKPAFIYFRNMSGSGGERPLNLPEDKCPIVGNISIGEAGPSLCEDTANLDLASFSITREMIDASVAKALNPPRVVVTPPVKKTTIICVKGKLTKKVTAVKPKCPSGYKKK